MPSHRSPHRSRMTEKLSFETIASSRRCSWLQNLNQLRVKIHDRQILKTLYDFDTSSAAPSNRRAVYGF